MAVIKIDPTAALRWKENLRFDLEVGNDHLDWDWAGNGPSPYSTVIHTATPSPNLLAELKEIFSQAEYEEFFRAIVGAAVTVVSCRPFRSTPHESAGTGPQSWHEDGCPAGVIRGVLYLTDVSENNGPFQYKRSDGSEQTVLGNVGDLLVFDAMRLNHRAMPPKENVRVALDFVFIPRLSHQKLDVAWAGLNHWPADPFFFSIPTSKSAIRQSSRQPQTPIRTHNGHAPSGVGGSAGELMRESDAIRAELAAIRASTSWRVTAPLRRLVDIIRK